MSGPVWSAFFRAHTALFEAISYPPRFDTTYLCPLSVSLKLRTPSNMRKGNWCNRRNRLKIQLPQLHALGRFCVHGTSVTLRSWHRGITLIASVHDDTSNHSKLRGPWVPSKSACGTIVNRHSTHMFPSPDLTADMDRSLKRRCTHAMARIRLIQASKIATGTCIWAFKYGLLWSFFLRSCDTEAGLKSRHVQTRDEYFQTAACDEAYIVKKIHD